jgi:hypothetical protein
MFYFIFYFLLFCSSLIRLFNFFMAAEVPPPRNIADIPKNEFDLRYAEAEAQGGDAILRFLHSIDTIGYQEALERHRKLTDPRRNKRTLADISREVAWELLNQAKNSSLTICEDPTVLPDTDKDDDVIAAPPAKREKLGYPSPSLDGSPAEEVPVCPKVEVIYDAVGLPDARVVSDIPLAPVAHLVSLDAPALTRDTEIPGIVLTEEHYKKCRTRLFNNVITTVCFPHLNNLLMYADKHDKEVAALQGEIKVEKEKECLGMRKDVQALYEAIGELRDWQMMEVGEKLNILSEKVEDLSKDVERAGRLAATASNMGRSTSALRVVLESKKFKDYNPNQPILPLKDDEQDYANTKFWRDEGSFHTKNRLYPIRRYPY